ncbi:Phenazine biosynthesis PhzC/PhzF protein [Cordyceps fumosorosea ARSEF 2679]|uniref:Phenazine biosynthesis PhzC/PhzF protein n=1 Tax=Cordyceps fumosorosea (strain ARSEF 2679) TaxID=1081104 RepID=A0A168BT49_CORFA|nr:Phenazine biosynthesis PhzC/PhzF protein [Cordyceps fumosorosea ARSEF 2679]OAA70516.1 Phenazine biosynthesis PhzC/PhzF protein [Cordyceps fumosorosea ARSEF 2679]
MELPFETYDVFTDTPYRGNPLAVVTVPASLPAPPTQAQKQAVAREFNLSETIFIHEPPADQPSSTSRTVDIFVTNAEIPFAGHPTIGAAVSLLSNPGAGVDTIVTKAGPIPVAAAGPGAARAAIPHNVHLHAKRLRDLPSPPAGLSEVPALRAAELDAPVYSIVRGMSFVLIELPSLEALAQATQSPFTGPVDELLDDGWRSGLCCRFYWVRTGTTTETADDGEAVEAVKLRTRMIDALCEDPATGSASSALCCYLSAALAEQKAPRRRYELTQGVEMGRESNIVVEVTMKEDAIDQVHLSGKAVKIMKGTLII